MQKTLKLTDHQFQIAITVLYVYVMLLVLRPPPQCLNESFRPYICTELPANLVLKKIGPNILMPTILVLWGIVVTFQGRDHLESAWRSLLSH